MIHTIETLKELHEQRFVATDKAIVLAASELARRLDILNHAHEQAREKERDFIGREAYETFTRHTIDDFAGLRQEMQARFGRIESAQAKMFGGLLFAATILPLITGIMVYMLSGKSL